MQNYVKVTYIKDFESKDKVKCDHKTEYIFENIGNIRLNVGDFVGVLSCRKDNELAICRVKEVPVLTSEDIIDSIPNITEIRPILCKLSFNEYDKYINNKNRKEYINKKIEEEYKKASKLKILEAMAKDNPELEKLLSEYKSLE